MSIKTQLSALFQSFAGQQNVLTIPRPYLAFCGNDHLAALLLSQCIYWSQRTPDGWFAKSYEDWQEELGMSAYQVRRAVQKLEAFGLETELRRSQFHDFAPTTHYHINAVALEAAVEKFVKMHCEETSHSECKETSQSDTEETSQSYNTETIPETIPEIKEPPLPPEGDARGLPDRPAIFAFYETHFGLLTPLISDQLKDLVRDFLPAWVEEALLIAKENKAGAPYKYAVKILQRWRDEGRALVATPSTPAATDTAQAASDEAKLFDADGRPTPANAAAYKQAYAAYGDQPPAEYMDFEEDAAKRTLGWQRVGRELYSWKQARKIVLEASA